MLHHISLPVSNLAKSKALYDAALKELGFRCVYASHDFAGYGVEDGKDKLALKEVENAGCAGPGFHVALSAPDRGAVDRFHSIALEHGAKDCGPPPAFVSTTGPITTPRSLQI
jgi:catechol 2,3-dioxygenase-like lactoylglutathione lyase family enzyme